MTDDDSAASDDPGRIRSIAVHRDDVSTALEATLRSDREVVLRVTPPFSGRMRARLHNLGPGGSGSSPEAVTNADDEEGSDGDPARYTSIREISLSMSHHTRRSTRRWRTTRTPT